MARKMFGVMLSAQERHMLEWLAGQDDATFAAVVRRLIVEEVLARPSPWAIALDAQLAARRARFEAMTQRGFKGYVPKRPARHLAARPQPGPLSAFADWRWGVDDGDNET